jgi:hypothetical protein
MNSNNATAITATAIPDLSLILLTIAILFFKKY